MRVRKHIYVEFWKLVDQGNGVKKAMPAVGSDSILYPDRRWSIQTLHAKAQDMGRSKGFHGYMLRSGPMNRPSDRDLMTSVREIDYE